MINLLGPIYLNKCQIRVGLLTVETVETVE